MSIIAGFFIPIIFLLLVGAIQVIWNRSIVDALTIAAPISFSDAFGLVCFLVFVGFFISCGGTIGQSKES